MMQSAEGSFLHAVQRERRNPPPLMAIYSIKFLVRDEEEMRWLRDIDGIYGVIAIESSSDISILFNRKFGDPELINPEGLVKLSDIRQGLRVEGDIIIKAYLFSMNVSFNIMPPGILWRTKSDKCQYDKLLITEIKCGFTKIEVQYAVYRKATEAIVDVTLINLVGQSLTELSGRVKAWNTQVCSAISCLFEEEAVCSSVGKVGYVGLSLPLSRHAIVVPCNSSLVVHADICRGNVMFATGTIRFPVRSSGEEVQMIPGTSGMIEIKVTWLENDGFDKVQWEIVENKSD